LEASFYPEKENEMKLRAIVFTLIIACIASMTVLAKSETSLFNFMTKASLWHHDCGNKDVTLTLSINELIDIKIYILWCVML
jgi:hypothetical protein